MLGLWGWKGLVRLGCHRVGGRHRRDGWGGAPVGHRHGAAARQLQRVLQRGLVADVVGQQQDQSRVDGLAFGVIEVVYRPLQRIFHIGADALTRIAASGTVAANVAGVTNPLPASGGVEQASTPWQAANAAVAQFPRGHADVLQREKAQAGTPPAASAHHPPAPAAPTAAQPAVAKN
mgnify:CR=1 FL=1